MLKLSAEEIFLVDCCIEGENIHNLMLVYRMETDEKPYDVLMKRVKIMPLLTQPSGGKNHKNVLRIFISQL